MPQHPFEKGSMLEMPMLTIETFLADQYMEGHSMIPIEKE